MNVEGGSFTGSPPRLITTGNYDLLVKINEPLCGIRPLTGCPMQNHKTIYTQIKNRY